MNNGFTKSKKYSEKHHTQTRQCGLLNAGYATINVSHEFKIVYLSCICMYANVAVVGYKVIVYIVLVNARPNTGLKLPKMVVYHPHFPAFSKFLISKQKPPTFYTCCTVDCF